MTVGAGHDPETQALGLLLNDRLGNLGRTIHFTEPLALAPPDACRSLEALADAMRAGQVSSLAILDAYPAYAAPADLGFAELMTRVETIVLAGLDENETAALIHLH